MICKLSCSRNRHSVVRIVSLLEAVCFRIRKIRTKKGVFIKSFHKNTRGKVTYSVASAHKCTAIDFAQEKGFIPPRISRSVHRLDNTLLVFVVRFFCCFLVLSQGISIGVNFSTQAEIWEHDVFRKKVLFKWEMAVNLAVSCIYKAAFLVVFRHYILPNDILLVPCCRNYGNSSEG